MSRPPRRPGPHFWSARGLLFRCLAMLLGVVPIALCEAVLAAMGVGEAETEVDPFVGFSATRRLFERDESGTRYAIPRPHHKFFRPESFGAEKGPDEFRIFCLGGSTVQGRPFAIETSFTTWLELALEAADPSRTWEVVNCGGVSYASYRLAPILREILDHYEPDLIILYTGHNEFLEDRSYRHLRQIPRPLMRALGPIGRLRTTRALGGAIAPDEGEAVEFEGDRLGPEVVARLDRWGGLADYRRDDAWRAGVVEHFAFNVERMVEMATQQGVPILLADPVVNLETPPFKSQHREGLTEAERRRFEALREEARSRFDDDLPGAIARLEQAEAIDGRHAGLLYALGKCYQQVGRLDEARATLIRAKEEDICPLRIVEPMREHLHAIADRTGAPILGFDALFSGRAEGGIVGNRELVDHVHPSILNHQVIAGAYLEEMARLGMVRPVEGWEEARDRSFQEHFAGLDAMYFLKGEQRLHGLRAWAAGRANPSKAFPETGGVVPEGL